MKEVRFVIRSFALSFVLRQTENICNTEKFNERPTRGLRRPGSATFIFLKAVHTTDIQKIKTETPLHSDVNYRHWLARSTPLCLLLLEVIQMDRCSTELVAKSAA